MSSRVTPPYSGVLRRRARTANVRHVQLTALCIGAFDLVFWPTDLFFFRGQPTVLHSFGVARLAIALGAAALGLGLRLFPALRRAYALEIFTCAVCGGGLFSFGYQLGEMGGPEQPWFHYSYLFLLLPLVVWLSPAQRIAATAAFALTLVLGYFGCHPAYLRAPLAWPALGFTCFAAAASALIGLYIDRIRDRSFFLRRKILRQARGLEHRVAEQTAELSALAAHLESAQELERARIARELHDELGQELTALRYAVGAAQTRFEQNPAAIRANLQQLSSLIQRVTRTTRDLLTELRPRVLDDLGLVAALEWLCQRAEERAGLRCACAAGGIDETSVPAGVAAAAFRIAQESLTNVMRHAGARQVRIRVEREGGALLLTIGDDGVGLRPRERRGMGILGMRERARSLGGDLWVLSEQGAGTTVRARLPMPAQGGPEAIS